MNNRKKFGIATAAVGLALTLGGLVGVGSASAIAGPTLTVNGSGYQPVANPGGGDTFQYQTAGNLSAATLTAVSDRTDCAQNHPDCATWNGVNGLAGNSTNGVVCPGGDIFWVSNAQLLTISHCVTVTTTTAPQVTTTTAAEVTTTTAAQVTTTTAPEVTTTTAPEVTTTTAGQVTTTTAAEVTTTTAEVTTTTAETTTTVGEESGGPTTTTIADTTTTAGEQSGGPTTTLSSGGGLPRTGASQSILVFLGLAMILGGILFIALTRRPDEA